jgi:hypothetical protein
MPERDHQRPALFLAHRAAGLGALPADRLLNRIERRDAFERFAGDRSVAVLGDVEELAPQVRPTERERDRLVACGAGNGLVGGVAVTLHDAVIAIEQLQRVGGTATGA